MGYQITTQMDVIKLFKDVHNPFIPAVRRATIAHERVVPHILAAAYNSFSAMTNRYYDYAAKNGHLPAPEGGGGNYGDFYPATPIRVNKVFEVHRSRINETRRRLKAISINIDAITSQLAANEHIDYVDDVYVDMGISPTSNKPWDIEYMYRWLKKTREASFYHTGTSFLVHQEEKTQRVFFSSISVTTVGGLHGKAVGSYRRSGHSYTHYVSNSAYIRVSVSGLYISHFIRMEGRLGSSSYSAKIIRERVGQFLPVDRRIVQDMDNLSASQCLGFSLQLNIYVYHKRKKKWYEAVIKHFIRVAQIFAVVMAIFTLGQSLYLVAAAGSLAAVAQVVATIAIRYAASYAVRRLLEEVATKIGGEVAAVLMVAIGAASLAMGGSGGVGAMPDAGMLVNLGKVISQAADFYIQWEKDQLNKDILQHERYTTKYMNEIDRVRKEAGLDNNDQGSFLPTKLVFYANETPDDFYRRTINLEIPSQVLGGIGSFVDYRLSLTTHNTVPNAIVPQQLNWE